MPRGDKSSYTEKQQRQAEHIEEGYERRGVPEDEAERRAWATVNKSTGGGKRSRPPQGSSFAERQKGRRHPQAPRVAVRRRDVMHRTAGVSRAPILRLNRQCVHRCSARHPVQTNGPQPDGRMSRSAHGPLLYPSTPLSK